MSRTQHGEKGPGYDYWSRRHPSNGSMGYGLWIKKMTCRWERRQANKEVRRECDPYR